MEAGEDGVAAPLLTLYDDAATVVGDSELHLLVLLELEFLGAECKFLAVGIEFGRVASKEGKIYLCLQVGTGVVDGSNVPQTLVTTSEDDIFAGIAVNELSVFPCSGYSTHEVHRLGGSILKVVGGETKHLYGVLEENGSSELEGVACATDSATVIVAVEAFVEDGSAKLHAAHRVADKGVQ